MELLFILIMLLAYMLLQRRMNPMSQKNTGIMAFGFDMQRFGTELPVNPIANPVTAGKDYLVYINTGTAAVPIWSIIGGLRGTTLNESSEEIDGSNKSSGGWPATAAGLKKWSVDTDGLIPDADGDIGLKAMRRAKRQGKAVNFKFRYPDNTYQIGWAIVTEFNKEAPYDAEATYSLTLNGSGPLSDISITVSKAAATDQVFYFEKSAVVTAITLASAAVAADNYTATTAGEITLEGTYLATLATGEHVFYASLSVGGYELLAITITA